MVMVQQDENRLGVVIVNYNSGDYLKQCLDSLFLSSVSLDIIVVDNYSSDGSVRFLEQLPTEKHKVTIIVNKINKGFSRAVNQGVARLINKKYVFLLNPDCTVFPGTLLALQQTMDSDDGIGIVGATVFNPDGTEQRGCRRNEPNLMRSIVTALSLEKYFEGVNKTREPFPSQPIEIDAVSGAAMMIRMDYLKLIGGMDEDYFLHCEDLDICRKFRDQGYLVVFCPQASVIHRQGGSSGTSDLQVESYKHEGMLLYAKKHPAKKIQILEYGVNWCLIKIHLVLLYIRSFVHNVINKFGRSITGLNKNKEFTSLEVIKAEKPFVLVTGAKSDVGDYFLKHIPKDQYYFVAVNRNSLSLKNTNQDIRWLDLDYFIKNAETEVHRIHAWVNLAPVWTTRSLLEIFGRFFPEKMVAVSSTSIEGKSDSEHSGDREIVEKIRQGEAYVKNYSSANGIGATILRPTLIYGGPRNQNINFIKKVIRLFRCFITVGEGKAKRQPVHAEDVAMACISALQKGDGGFSIYNIPGGEQLEYKEMIHRIFSSMNTKSRFITIPEKFAKAVVRIIGRLPGLRFLNEEMITRMNKDLVYSGQEAMDNLSYKPRKFLP